MDAPVAPGRILAGKSDREPPSPGSQWWPSGRRCRWLGPVEGDEAAVRADHGCGLHDERHPAEPSAVEDGGEHCDDRPVRLGEGGTRYLRCRTRPRWRGARTSASRSWPVAKTHRNHARTRRARAGVGRIGPRRYRLLHTARKPPRPGCDEPGHLLPQIRIGSRRAGRLLSMLVQVSTRTGVADSEYGLVMGARRNGETTGRCHRFSDV